MNIGMFISAYFSSTFDDLNLVSKEIQEEFASLVSTCECPDEKIYESFDENQKLDKSYLANLIYQIFEKPELCESFLKDNPGSAFDYFCRYSFKSALFEWWEENKKILFQAKTYSSLVQFIKKVTICFLPFEENNATYTEMLFAFVDNKSWAEIVLSSTGGIDFYLQNGVVNQVFIELIRENLETTGQIDIKSIPSIKVLLHAFNWQYTLNCIKAYFCVDYIANNAQNSIDCMLIRIFEIQNQGISDIQLQEASPYSEYAVKLLGERKVPLAIPGVCETSTWIAGVMSNIVYSDINFDAKRFLETVLLWFAMHCELII